MDGLAPFAIELTPWIALFMTIVARLSFVVFFMPGIGEQVVPVRARALLLVALAIALASAGFLPPPPVNDIPGLFSLILTETVIGFSLGAMLRLSIWMLTIAGTVIAQSIGLAQFLGIALEHEAQTVTANLLSMAGAAVLLSANFHVEILASIARLYGDIPMGAASMLNGPMLIQGFYSAFSFALLLAWPFVAFNLLYNICLGFINKALPSLMVAFVGAPFMVGAGVALLALSAAGLLIAWKDRVFQVIPWL